MLDDYEEGTWTPVITGLTLTTADGTYTKIGSIVTAHFSIDSDSTTSTSAVFISGLPFNREGSSANRGAGVVHYSATAPASQLLFALGGSSEVQFRQISNGDTLSITEVSGELFWCTLVYQAA